MTQSIYEQFDKATKSLTAYAILKGGQPIGKIVFTYPRDGAGRQWCWVHILGATMVRGYASGVNSVDKHRAAALAAARNLRSLQHEPGDPNIKEHAHAWRMALEPDGGHSWDRQLRDRGYTVFQVV